MHAQTYANPVGYLFIIVGVLLSVVSALVPHFESGYRLITSIFIAGILPYIVYGFAVPLIRGPVTTMTGLVVTAMHAMLVADQRFIRNADYSDVIVYYVPMAIALAALPLLVIAVRKSNRR